MLQTLHDKGLSTKIITPMSKERLGLCGFTLIDGSDIVADLGNINNLQLTIERK